jgi:hypothetical protein
LFFGPIHEQMGVWYMFWPLRPRGSCRVRHFGESLRFRSEDGLVDQSRKHLNELPLADDLWDPCLMSASERFGIDMPGEADHVEAGLFVPLSRCVNCTIEREIDEQSTAKLPCEARRIANDRYGCSERPGGPRNFRGEEQISH